MLAKAYRMSTVSVLAWAIAHFGCAKVFSRDARKVLTVAPLTPSEPPGEPTEGAGRYRLGPTHTLGGLLPVGPETLTAPLVAPPTLRVSLAYEHRVRAPGRGSDKGIAEISR